jgi:heat shock protein HslJ
MLRMPSLRFAVPTLAAAALLTGASTALAAPDPMVLGLWKIEQARAAPLQHKLNARIDFRPDGQIVANGGCNSITGSYTLEGGTLKLGALAVTRKVCNEALMEQEDRVISALERSVHARVPPHGLLELKDELGTVMLRGSRPEATPAQ